MKKTTLTVVLLLSVICAFGQKKAARQAYNEALALENPNFQEARTLISGALEHPESKDDAYTWYVAGVVENTIYDTDLAKKQLGQTLPNGDDAMYNAVINSYNYYLKAVELDSLPNEKGKVKPKYTKKIKKALMQNLGAYYDAAVHYYNAQDYQKSYDAWGILLEIGELPFIKGEKSLPNDTALAYYELNRAKTAEHMKNNDFAIKSFNELKNNRLKHLYESDQNFVYQRLVILYEGTKDTTNLINTLLEGEKLFKMVETYDEQGNVIKDANGNVIKKSEKFYTMTLVKFYVLNGQQDKAIETLDRVLSQDPENAEYWQLKGDLLCDIEKYDEAVPCLEKALAINPEYASALSSMGRIYFNQGAQKNNEIDQITNNAKYQEALNNEVLPLFQKALPYYEKAYKLDPDNKNIKYALRNIYYKLNDKRMEDFE